MTLGCKRFVEKKMRKSLKVVDWTEASLDEAARSLHTLFFSKGITWYECIKQRATFTQVYTVFPLPHAAVRCLALSCRVALAFIFDSQWSGRLIEIPVLAIFPPPCYISLRWYVANGTIASSVDWFVSFVSVVLFSIVKVKNGRNH